MLKLFPFNDQEVFPPDHPGINELQVLVNWSRFWCKIDIGETDFNCMIWTASTDSSGYGNFGVSGRTLSSHRLGFLFTYNTLPVIGFELHHECTNRACVNGLHLMVVPHVVNMELSRRTLERVPSRVTKDNCKYGHLLTSDNIYVDKRGWSECRTCRQENVRRWRRTNSKEVMS